ncbi:TniB family NTP-binding protein [Paracoccus sp. IB05]|uniref:TniB family NTP-binding protein n=1 Tax=Paracoccus sp. IB05 TaxID=2779367 RepID=UPI0018E8F8EF|nr:TniB family NTP-binding protein [Paracoccus sp. IB05]MBJ2153963.1 TniB family NTP-binding protein [Paracoccus sp. IB05]
MNDIIRSTALKIATLRGHYVRHERFDPLQARFRLLIEKRLADIAGGRNAEAHGIALSGASGTGKSCAIAQLIARSRQDLAQSSLPSAAIISLRVPSPATLKFVGQTILRALGYHLSSERQAWYIWDLVRHQLREREVLFLHLDEAQDLSTRGTRHELDAVASMLKTLMTDEGWPVGILLSGTQELESILNHDPQLARRMDTVHFGALSPVSHAPDVAGLIESYARRADLGLAEDASEIALAERLIHAAAFQFGLVIEIIIGAIEMALMEGGDHLEWRHFKLAYEVRSSCADAFNPFVVDDYHRIDTRQVFKRGDE